MCQHRLELCDQRCVADMLDTTFYVACLKLTGRRCLVVGARAMSGSRRPRGSWPATPTST